MKTKVCESCGYVGKPIADEFSSFTVDAMVWLAWSAIAVITGIFPLILIAPLFSLIHIAKFRTMKCPKCENLEMVNLHSHAGEEIMHDHHSGTPHHWTDKDGPIPH